MYAEPAEYRSDVDHTEQQKAVERIDAILGAAERDFDNALKQVAEIADKFDIRVRVGTPAGGTATYVPNLPKDWDGSSCSYSRYEARGEWNSSSMYC